MSAQFAERLRVQGRLQFLQAEPGVGCYRWFRGDGSMKFVESTGENFVLLLRGVGCRAEEFVHMRLREFEHPHFQKRVLTASCQQMAVGREPSECRKYR